MIRRTDAIVLARSEFGNSSLVVTFATRAFGQVRVLAKGARRASARRFARPPEPFARGELLFYPPRERSASTAEGGEGAGLAVLKEWSEDDERLGLRESPAGAGVLPPALPSPQAGEGPVPGALRAARLAVAHGMSEIALEATREGAPDPEFFDELEAALARASRARAPSAAALALVAFEAAALVHLGAWPDFSSCVGCGSRLEEPSDSRGKPRARPAPAVFVPAGLGPGEPPGGLRCSICVAEEAAAEAAHREAGGAGAGSRRGAIKLSPEALEIARAIERTEGPDDGIGPGAEVPVERLRASPCALSALLRAFGESLARAIEKPLRTLRRAERALNAGDS